MQDRNNISIISYKYVLMIQLISLFLQMTCKRGTYDLSNWVHFSIQLGTCFASKSQGGPPPPPLSQLVVN